MKTALIVTDMQNGFMNGSTRPLISRIKALLLKKQFDFILFTKFINQPDSPFARLIGYKGLRTVPDTEIVPGLVSYATHVFVKHSYAPFTTEFSEFLKREQITHLYFVGVDTNACVHTGAVDAFSRGYVPYVLADYCASHSGKEYHLWAIKNLQKLIGKGQVTFGDLPIRDDAQSMGKKRATLPFRRNCEGYFFDNQGNVLARMSDGFLVFPGGGVNNNETVQKALVRETYEETGAVVRRVRKVGELRFRWGPSWAKTTKQKERYEKYQGEDMHFFVGEIERFEEPTNKQEDFWEEEKLMSVTKAIHFIEAGRPFDEDIKRYRELQLRFLKGRLDSLGGV